MADTFPALDLYNTAPIPPAGSQNSILGRFLEGVTDIGQEYVRGYFLTKGDNSARYERSIYADRPVESGKPANVTVDRQNGDMIKYGLLALGAVAAIMVFRKL